MQRKVRKQIGILRLAMLMIVTFSCGLAIGGVIPEHVILVFAPIIIIGLMIYDDLHQKYVKGMLREIARAKNELEKLESEK